MQYLVVQVNLVVKVKWKSYIILRKYCEPKEHISSKVFKHRCGWIKPDSITSYQSGAQQRAIMTIWVFPKIGVPQNGWLIMENPIKMDDLGGTPIFGNTYISPICKSDVPNLFSFFRIMGSQRLLRLGMDRSGRGCHCFMQPPRDTWPVSSNEIRE